MEKYRINYEIINYNHLMKNQNYIKLIEMKKSISLIKSCNGEEYG